MSLTTRVLPKAEYFRLEGTELESVWPLLPADAEVLAVEDDGELVGCWALLKIYHAECLWIKDSHRRRGGVALRLWRGMRGLVKRAGLSGVCTASTDAMVTNLIERLGGHKLPGEHFTIPVGV